MTLHGVENAVDSFGETRLVGAHEPRVMQETDFIKLVNRAAEWRKTSQTAKNEFSSRSHAICKISITDHRAPGAPDCVSYLVDLAGSEMAADLAQHSAERMRETRDINKSLSVLKDCIRVLAQLGDIDNAAPKKDYVPFRQSALNKVLKHVFEPTSGRDCKTAVVACINPSYKDIPASKNSLRYAEMLRVSGPKLPPVQYDTNDPKTWSNAQARAWISANCGSPKIDANIVAPYHTGQQLLRMPETEFIARCQGTESVTEEQATVLHSTLWRMHISQEPLKEGHSSAVANTVPFKDRLRPGIVVKAQKCATEEEKIVMIMSPSAFGSNIPEKVVSYTCATVTPAVFRNAFTRNVWQQLVGSRRIWYLRSFWSTMRQLDISP